MKFNEAMQKLEEGLKVTRAPWADDVYFLMDGKDVKSYQSKLTPYIYNEDIMISEGWLLNDGTKEFKFYDIIPYLQGGHKTRMKAWSKDCFIYYDPSIKGLVSHIMEMFPFSIDFEAFVAQDWMVIS